MNYSKKGLFFKIRGKINPIQELICQIFVHKLMDCPKINGHDYINF